MGVPMNVAIIVLTLPNQVLVQDVVAVVREGAIIPLLLRHVRDVGIVVIGGVRKIAILHVEQVAKSHVKMHVPVLVWVLAILLV